MSSGSQSFTMISTESSVVRFAEICTMVFEFLCRNGFEDVAAMMRKGSPASVFSANLRRFQAIASQAEAEGVNMWAENVTLETIFNDRDELNSLKYPDRSKAPKLTYVNSSLHSVLSPLAAKSSPENPFSAKPTTTTHKSRHRSRFGNAAPPAATTDPTFGSAPVSNPFSKATSLPTTGSAVTQPAATATFGAAPVSNPFSKATSPPTTGSAVTQPAATATFGAAPVSNPFSKATSPPTTGFVKTDASSVVSTEKK